MLLRMIEENMQIDEILFCDTGLEFPEMYDHLKKVEAYIGRPITKLKAEKDFMYFATQHEFVVPSDSMLEFGFSKGQTAKGYDYPSKFARWCTKELKTRLIDNHFKELKVEFDVVRYIGIAADERHREKEHRYPLIEWGMTEQDALQYCKDRGFDWGGLYDIWDRVSCWCCPLQGLDDLRKLKNHRPQLWEQLKTMDREISKAYQPMFRFKRATLMDTDKRFDVEDEFIAQGKKLRTKEFFDELKRRGIRYI